VTPTPTDPATGGPAGNPSAPDLTPPLPEASPPPPLPTGLAADPDAYDSERNRAARARGLSAPYIAGGRDPEPEAGIQEERRYLRLLLIMVAAIIIGGFVLGIVANVMNGAG
jgi:hypothetical protein